MIRDRMPLIGLLLEPPDSGLHDSSEHPARCDLADHNPPVVWVPTAPHCRFGTGARGSP